MSSSGWEIIERVGKSPLSTREVKGERVCLITFHPFASPLGSLGLFLLFLYAGFVIEASFLHLGKEAFLG